MRGCPVAWGRLRWDGDIESRSPIPSPIARSWQAWPPTIASDANEQVADYGRNRQVDAVQSNQLRPVSVASLPIEMHQDAAAEPDRPAVNEMAMSITDNLSVAGIGKGELSLLEVKRITLPARAEPGRARISLLTSLLS
jgi:hypothetical protein